MHSAMHAMLLMVLGLAALTSASAQTPIRTSSTTFYSPYCEIDDAACSRIELDDGQHFAFVLPVDDAPVVDGEGANREQTAAGFNSTVPCPTRDVRTAPIPSNQQISNQFEICLNDVRLNPSKYASLFRAQSGCNYDSWIASVSTPKRKIMRGTGTAPANALDLAAQRHSADMAAKNYFSHNSQDGTTPWTRISRAGLTGGWSALAENIAAGQRSVSGAMVSWMCSSGHRNNMMSCGLNTMGTGFAWTSTSTYKYYWTQDFACIGTCTC